METPSKASIKEAIECLLIDYARALDENRLEDWPQFFVEDGCYKVVSRENVESGLDAPMIYHYSRNMLKDRVMALRDALTYEPVYSRHFISNVALLGEKDGILAVTSNYAVYQSTEEGQTRLFSVGRYLDEVVFEDSAPRFKTRTVVVDTFAIPNNLATPL